MKLYLPLLFLLLIVSVSIISCKKEKRNYTNSDAKTDTTIIFEKIAGSRTLKFFRRIDGYKSDTSYSLPSETFIVQYIDPETIHLPRLKNCFSPEANLTFKSGLSKNSVRVYTFNKDFTKIALYYDYIADTMYIEDMFTQKDPNSMGGNITYYYTIGSTW